MSQRQSDIEPTNDGATGTLLRPGRELFGLPRVYWLLWGGMLVNRLGGSVFFLLAVYLTGERGFSREMAGLVMTVYAAGGMIAGPIGGVLADRIGRRATLLIGTTGSGALMLALGWERQIEIIVATAALLGFFADLCRAPLQAAVADVVAPAYQPRAYGLLYWAINLGFAGAATLGGALAARSFGLLFVIDALTTFVYGAIVLFAVPETRPALPPTPVRTSGDRAWLAPFRDRTFMAFMATQVLLLIAFDQVIVTLPMDMRGHGLGTAQIGWLLGLNGVFIVIAQPPALRLVRGFSNAQWLAAGAVLTGLGLGAMAFAHGMWLYAVATFVWTLGEIGFSTAAPSLTAALSPARQRGVYQGTFQLTWGLAATIGPLVGSVVLARFGGATLWLGCLVTCLIAAALHLTFAARYARAEVSRAEVQTDDRAADHTDDR